MKTLIQFEKRSFLFDHPKSIISCYDPSSFNESFREMERALKSGYYLAGFMSYEAGYCFEERLHDPNRRDFPLVYMGVYDPPVCGGMRFRASHFKNELEGLRLNISKPKYSSNIETIREHIRRGDVYQITYCIKLLFKFSGDPAALYAALLREQPVPYPA